MERWIDKYLTKLLSEEQADRWIVIVAEIVRLFINTTHDEQKHVIGKIIQAIRKDSLTKLDELGIMSLRNSAKWNSIALTFFNIGFLREALEIFKELLVHEPDNSASQNNMGIALMAAGNFDRAKELLTKAFETDRKRSPQQAKKMPAYQNLLLIETSKPRPPPGRATPMGNPSFHNIMFMDIVGFSRPSWYGTIQVQKITYLNETVRTILGELGLNYMEVPMLPTGDGIALFFENVEHPIKLTIELTRRLKEYSKTQPKDKELEVRIGIHAGDSFPVKDLHCGGNRCGPAINTARRVLDLGQALHILCTSYYGDRLKLLFGSIYESLLHDCGEYIVKHGEKINIFNIYNEEFGNPDCPTK